VACLVYTNAFAVRTEKSCCLYKEVRSLKCRVHLMLITMKRGGALAAMVLLAGIAKGRQPAPEVVLFDFSTGENESLIRTEGATARAAEGALHITVTNKGESPPSVFLLPSRGHWDLSGYRYVEMNVRNPGDKDVALALFVFVPGGWGGISTFPLHANGREVIRARATHTLKIDLHQRFPDGTESIDPRNVTHLRIVFYTNTPGTAIDVLCVGAVAQAPAEPHAISGRLHVPKVIEGPPARRKRVYMQLPDYSSPALRYVL